MNLQSELREFQAQVRRIDLILNKYSATIQKVQSEVLKTEFPLTYLSMLAFLPRMDSLRDALLATARRRELYPCQIIVRAIIEHFARFCYLYMRHVEDQSDIVGHEYAVIAKHYEDLQYGNAARMRVRFLDPSINFDPFEKLHEVVPSARAYSKREMTSTAKKFGFSNVVAYISDRCKMDSGETLAYFPNALLAYSETSAHVHGGASAVLKVDTEIDKRKCSKELYRISEIAYGSAFSARELVFESMKEFDSRLRPCCKALKLIAKRDQIRSAMQRNESA